MEIVSTIGPATFKPSMIRMLYCAGVTVFRLNLSHTQTRDEIEEFFDMVNNETQAKICLDTHGSKFSTKKGHPSFTNFDTNALRKYGETCHYVAASYAQSADAVKQARMLSCNKNIVAKIESKIGFDNRKEIIKEADTVLIDRGDLSKTVPIEDTPYYCREIIRSCMLAKTPVWVATNLLESMTHSPTPTLGEVNDVASLLNLDIDGLVLAAETAIGKHPIECVQFISKMIERHENA
jgi:pyruvate kinase